MGNKIPIYTGPIAILDMLGFKTYVETNSIQSVIDEYASVLTGATFTAEVMNESLEFMVYSDTIAIRLINQTEKGFYNFIKSLQLISNSYFYKCLIPGMNPIPVRGAISYGEYSWYKGDISTQAMGRDPIVAKNVNFIVGKAILDAHDLESKQNWIGISLTQETGQVLKDIFPNAFNELESTKHILSSKIPLKEGQVNGYLINPTERSMFNESFIAFCSICKRHVESTADFRIKQKYVHTLEYLKTIYDENFICPMWRKEILDDIPRKPLDICTYNEVIIEFNKQLSEFKCCC